jgi:hypothetical protein
MTLLSVSNSEGTRRCDARCYNAQHPGCDCICQGRNHGVGLARAIEHTRDFARAGMMAPDGDEIVFASLVTRAQWPFDVWTTPNREVLAGDR